MINATSRVGLSQAISPEAVASSRSGRVGRVTRWVTHSHIVAITPDAPDRPDCTGHFDTSTNAADSKLNHFELLTKASTGAAAVSFTVKWPNGITEGTVAVTVTVTSCGPRATLTAGSVSRCGATWAR